MALYLSNVVAHTAAVHAALELLTLLACVPESRHVKTSTSPH